MKRPDPWVRSPERLRPQDHRRTIEPKLHVDTDLWYYFGRKSPPSTGGIVIKNVGI